MIDHDNKCKNIRVQYLTLTFISKSNLGRNPLKVTKQAHSDLCTLYVLVIISFYFILGNHESINMNQMYGFDGEVRSKYPYN
jgi:hypothetical protein